MIVYIDTSALIKLLVDEVGSEQVEQVWDSADVLASSVLVVVEARAALASAMRSKRLDRREHDGARTGLAMLVDQLHLIEITGRLVDRAADLAEAEALRGYDAVHLAAALTVGADVFASADVDLCRAAEQHGLHVANPHA